MIDHSSHHILANQNSVQHERALDSYLQILARQEKDSDHVGMAVTLNKTWLWQWSMSFNIKVKLWQISWQLAVWHGVCPN